MKRQAEETETIAKKLHVMSPNLALLFKTPGVFQGSSQGQALRMATFSNSDEPMGTASIASCLALVLALISVEEVKTKLLSFLGFQDISGLLSLMDPYRVLSVLLSPAACVVLKDSPYGSVCRELWEVLGAECIPLEGDIEAQVNEMVKKHWETKEDVFKPRQLCPKPKALDLALVAMDDIKVSWLEEFKKYEWDDFYTSGKKVRALFCVDPKPRMMFNFSFEGGNAVLLPCKPDEKTGKERGMVFVLPPLENQNLNKCLELFAKKADNGICFKEKKKYNFSFPPFDVKKSPATIKTWIEKFVPEIFTSDSQCMDGTLPSNVMGGPAYVGDVQHGASIKADRKGAVAKAVTVAPIIVYRKVDIPDDFICDRPFITILATLKRGTEDTKEVENIEFVTKHETSDMLDLAVDP